MPPSLRFLAAISLLLAAASAQDGPFADHPTLSVGVPVEIELQSDDPFLSSKGRGRWFRMAPEASGPLTIDVESHDLDVFLIVRDESNEEIARDMGSGVEWNAHLVLQAEAGRTYRIGALVASEALGSLRVSVREGGLPVPEGRELLRARIAFNREAARRARERADEEALSQFLLNAGNLSFNLGDLAAAQPCFEELLELAGRRGDGMRTMAARAFLGALEARWHQPKALEHLEPALRDARALGHDAVERFVLDNLGTALADAHRRPEALDAWQSMLDSARAADDQRTVVIALRKLGQAQAEMGEAAAARRLLTEALDVAARLDDADALAEALLTLGNDHLIRGEVLEALDCFEQGLDAGPGEELSMALLGSRGTVHLKAGRYDDARTCFLRVLEFAGRSDLHRLQAAAHQNLGLVSFYLGDLHAALEALDRALALLDPQDADGQARVHYDRSVAWKALGDIDRERDELELGLQRAREADLPEREALLLAQLGAWSLAQDDPDAAWLRLEEAAARLPQGVDGKVRGVVLTNMAGAAFEAGDPERATQLAREAADLLLGWGEAGSALDPLHTMARSALEQRDAAAVEAALAEAEPLLMRPLLAGLGLDERAGVRSLHADWAEVETDLVALRLDEAGEDEELRARIVADGFLRAGRWKGRALLEGLAAQRRPRDDGETAALQRERNALLADDADIGRALARSRSTGAPAAEVAGLASRAKDVRLRMDALTARLQQLAPREALLEAPRGITPVEARAALLSPGRILIDYVEGERTLHAYVLTTETLAFVDLGSRDEIEALCRQHLDGMTDPDHLAPVEDVVATGGALHRRVLAPALAAAGVAVTGLLVVPSGEVSLLPFESLVMAGDGASSFADVEFVLDRLPVGYGPSTPVLVALAETAPRTTTGHVMVLGDPVYPIERPALGRFEQRGVPRADQLARLPATRDEALAVAQVVLRSAGETDALEQLAPLRDERSAVLQTPAIELYLGEEASPERLRGDLSACSVLHCASHGYADPQDPRRSGLVLAFGADRAGYVPLADVLELRLDADLTVLSACQTARGRVLRGEGVQSVARAFLHAGSRSVVASLWQVSDVETALTMEGFYQAWMTDGERLPEALHAAKRAVRSGLPVDSPAVRGGLLRAAPTSRTAGTTSHPYYWAPFVHIGRP